MQLTVNSTIFAQELRLLNKVAPAKAAVPVLSGVLLSAIRPVEGSNQLLQMYATDLEIGLRTECPIQLEMPGSVVLPAARLLAMVEQFPNADVTISKDDSQINISCGAFRSRLQTLPIESFPVIPETTGQSYALNAPGLRKLIECTRYAVSDKPGQYFLQGGLLTLTGQLAAMVATDGKQLALATMEKKGGDARIVIPAKTMDMLVAQSDANEIQLYVGERHFFFVGNGRTIISRQIDGQFPSYERIIPKDHSNKATVDRFALASALRRVGLVSSEETSMITCAFSPGVLEMSATAAQVGHADERLPITYEGPSIKINVSWKAILSMLDVSSELTVQIVFKDERTQIMLLDGDHHLAVVLPMS